MFVKKFREDNNLKNIYCCVLDNVIFMGDIGYIFECFIIIFSEVGCSFDWECCYCDWGLKY